LKLEIHLLRWSVCDEAVIDVPFACILIRELSRTDLTNRSIEHTHLRANKSVRADPTELWAGYFEF